VRSSGLLLVSTGLVRNVKQGTKMRVRVHIARRYVGIPVHKLSIFSMGSVNVAEVISGNSF
jgi:hypothetical protein